MKLSSVILRQIIDEIPAIIIIYEKDKPVWFNKYTLKLTNYSEEEIKNRTIQELFPSFKKSKTEISEDKSQENFYILALLKKDGNFAYLKSLKKTIKIGNQYYGLIIGIDITSKVDLENKIKTITIPIQEVEVNRKTKAVKIIYLNSAIFELTGYDKNDLGDFESLIEKVHSDDREKILNFINQRYRNKKKFAVTFRFKKKTGRYLWIKAIKNNIREENHTIKFLLILIDITKEKRLQKKLEKTLSTLENLMKYSPDIVFLLDRKGKILYQSESLTKLGYHDKETVGKSILDFISADDREKFMYVLNQALENPDKTIKFEYKFLTRNGIPVWFEGHIVFSKKLKKFILIEVNISDRKIIETKLKRAIFYDLETGLANILMFKKYLRPIIRIAKSRNENFIIASIKIVNLRDLLFLSYSNKVTVKNVILEIVKRMESAFPTIYVARISFDEFIISVYTKINQSLDNFIKTLKEIFEKPILGQFLPLYNVGVAVFPTDAENETELLKKSLLALKKATESGINTISLYSSELEKELLEKQMIRAKLLEALKNRELTVYYQPIYSLKDNRIVGFEALIRWFSKDLGVVPPDKFIPIAEETDLILEIGRFALRKSLEDMKNLGKSCFVSVNFSSKQFSSENFLNDIMDALEYYRFNPELLVVEITERTAMENPEYTSKLLEELRKKRIKIALDDFGKGYSNMEYLIDFDIDKLKIDKDFVLKMLEMERARSVVRTVIDLAHSVGATALAEGIENEETLKELREMGCEEGQGFYFMPPVPFERIKEVVERSYCNKRKKLKRLLIELSVELGNKTLREILKKVLYQLGKENIEIPENPVNLDFSKFSEEDLQNFILLLAEELEVLNGLGYKERFLEKWGSTNLKE